jgi:hypothetical protein
MATELNGWKSIIMRGKYHWSNYYKRSELFGLSSILAIGILASVLHPFSIAQHLFLIMLAFALFYVQKVRGYIPYYFVKYLRTKIGGSTRNNYKYRKPS